MPFDLNEDQIAFQDTARSFAEEQFAPNAKAWDADKIFPKTELRAAASLGFGGIYVSEEVGGSALSRHDAAVIFEELSAGCTSTAAYISIHNMAAWMIDKFAADALRERMLPKLCSMEWLASYCLTEPNSGSDAAALKTKAVLDGDHYVLNGGKVFISGAGETDVYVCMVRTGDDSPKGVTCLAIEAGSPGLSFGEQERKMGWNSQPTAMVLFDNCRVPVANRIGQEGEGFKIAMAGLDGGRINIGACSIGAARAALEASKNYMGERKAFGQRLADFQALQFKLADMATDLEAARLMIHRAAQAVDTNHPDKTMYCAMAKRFATDAGFNVCNEALQIHGGYGYLQDFPFERMVRDTRVHQILEGTNEIMRVIIARKLLQDLST